jgi:hypothetical protein
VVRSTFVDDRERQRPTPVGIVAARWGWFVGLVGAALLIVTACQALPAREATPTLVATPVPTAPAPTAVPSTANIVWGKVPYCTCLTGIATANVSTALSDAHLPGTVKEHYPTGGWLYFVVSFDPKAASRDQIAAAIAAGGGTVVDGPP